MRWDHARPRILVVACSDGRLQEATDEFLNIELGVTHYDRLYIPGGAGALSPSGRDFLRAHQVRQECKYLVQLHGVERMFALFHGPGMTGPAAAVCADYRRKFPWASPVELRKQQEEDARELLRYRHEWSDRAAVSIYRVEVSASADITFVPLHVDAPPPDARA
jgi:hypothetical protein